MTGGCDGRVGRGERGSEVFGGLSRASLHRYFTPYVFLAVLPFSFRAFVFLRSARLSPPPPSPFLLFSYFASFSPFFGLSLVDFSLLLSLRLRTPFLRALVLFLFLLCRSYSPPLLPLLRPLHTLHPLIPSSSSFPSSSFPSFTPSPPFSSPHRPPTHPSSQTLLAFTLFTFLTSLIDAYFMFVFTATE